MAITSLYQTNRLTGLSSGMDTDTIVQNLMKLEQMKLNRELRSQTTLKWRQDSLKSVADSMTSFRRTFITTQGTDGMLKAGAYTSYNVSLLGSKSGAVSIRGTAEAAYTKVTVNKITQLAEGANVTGSKVSGLKESGERQTELSEGNYVRLGDLNFANELFTATKEVPKQKQSAGENGLEFMLQDGSKDLVYRSGEEGNYIYKNAKGDTVTLTDKQVKEMVPVWAGYETKPKVDTESGRLMFEGSDGNVYFQDTDDTDKYYNADGEVADLTDITLTPLSDFVMEEVPSDSISFKINGVEFNFNKDTRLADMFSAVNNSSAGVTMGYSRLTDSFSITAKDSGANTSLTIENGSGSAFGKDSAFGIAETAQRNEDGTVKMTTDKDGKEVIDHAAIAGKNAVVYINGTRVERAANTFSIDGISYTLNYETGTETEAEKTDGKIDKSNIDPEIEITATLTKDVSAAMDSIKKFVDGYNTMLAKLYTLVHEDKNSKYYALTDDEKSAMTDDQVKEWEAMAKSGILRNDRDIQNVLGKLREAFYATVEGAGLSAQEIGLRTNSRSGEITINDTDLRAALEKDSDQVMRVFMNISEAEDDATIYKEQGLLYRLEDILRTYTSDTQYTTNSSLDRQMSKLTDKIEAMQTKMAKLEEKYYLKYAAMETALSKMQSQSSSVTSLLNSLGG